MKTLVLSIDDDLSQHAALKGFFEDSEIEIISAINIVEAKQQFNQHKNILFVIGMDGFLNSDKPNTLELTAEIKNDPEFYGFIIAASSGYSENEKLIETGCDDCVIHRKSDINEMIYTVSMRTERIAKKLGYTGTDYWEFVREIIKERKQTQDKPNYHIFSDLWREIIDLE